MLLNSTAVTNIATEISGALTIKSLILIASPMKITTALNLFSKKLRLNNDQQKRFFDKIRSESSVNFDQLDRVYLQTMFPTQTNILSLHSIDDAVIPVEDTYYIQKLGGRVQIKEFNDLGHYRIIFDQRVLNYLKDFLTGKYL